MEANSEIVDAPEYEDAIAAEVFAGESESPSSKDSVNEAAGTPKAGFVETARDEVGEPLKLGLTALTASTEMWRSFGSGDPNAGFAGSTVGARGSSTLAFFHGVDVPHSAQERRIYPLTE